MLALEIVVDLVYFDDRPESESEEPERGEEDCHVAAASLNLAFAKILPDDQGGIWCLFDSGPPSAQVSASQKVRIATAGAGAAGAPLSPESPASTNLHGFQELLFAVHALELEV